MDWPVPDYMRFWGKAQPQDDRSVTWHPLAWHSLDVAATAEVLLDRDDAIARELASRSGATVTEAKRLLICLTALHDIGKFSLGFQAKVRDCFPSVLDFPATPKIGDHPAIGQRMLGEQEFAPFWDRLAPDVGDTPRQIFAGSIAGHHGRPAMSLDSWVSDEIGRKAIAAAGAFFADAVELLASEGFPGSWPASSI